MNRSPRTIALLAAALLAGGAAGTAGGTLRAGATATGATVSRSAPKTQQGKKGRTVKRHRRARHRGRCLRKRHHRCVAWSHSVPQRPISTTSKPGSGSGSGGGSGSGSGGTGAGGSGAGGSGGAGAGAGGTTGTTTAPRTTTTATTPPPLPSRAGVDVNDNGPPAQPYSMVPSHQQLAAGTVQFNVDNFGQDPHTFVIEDSTQTVVADANGSSDPANLPAGSSSGPSSQTITYNLPAGTYTMLCTLPDHANKGMKYTFTVG